MYIYVYIYIYIYRRLGGVVDPNREIGFGSVAVRCVAIAMRCGAIALRCVAIAMRCDAMRSCVCVWREERFCWLVFPVGSDRGVVVAWPWPCPPLAWVELVKSMKSIKSCFSYVFLMISLIILKWFAQNHRISLCFDDFMWFFQWNLMKSNEI